MVSRITLHNIERANLLLNGLTVLWHNSPWLDKLMAGNCCVTFFLSFGAVHKEEQDAHQKKKKKRCKKSWISMQCERGIIANCELKARYICHPPQTAKITPIVFVLERDMLCRISARLSQLDLFWHKHTPGWKDSAKDWRSLAIKHLPLASKKMKRKRKRRRRKRRSAKTSSTKPVHTVRQCLTLMAAQDQHAAVWTYRHMLSQQAFLTSENNIFKFGAKDIYHKSTTML